jgi:hypothetical protein
LKVFSIGALVKQILILLLGGYFIYGGFSPTSCGPVNSADLAFHEGGHVIFATFGNDIGMWGGTLMQLLLPLVIAVHFFKRGEDFSGRVVLCWFGQNFFHIASYIKDARAESLPLVGGGIHDWHYILGRAGLLNMDQGIGNIVWGIGFGIILYSVFRGILSAGIIKEEPSI